MKITRTKFTGFGNRIVDDGIYFAVSLNFLHDGGIILYDYNTLEEITRISCEASLCYGNVLCILVSDIKSDILYRLYEDDKLFTDIYSPVYYPNSSYGLPLNISDAFSKINVCNEVPGFDADTNPLTPYSDSLFYLAHVRGLTMLDKSVKHKGTFLGLSEKMHYFKEHNVTALILLPCYEFIECEKNSDESMENQIASYKADIKSLPFTNYWGFKSANYFSIKSAYSYSKDSELEFKQMIVDFHKSNIEIIMMMYFPDKTPGEFISSVLRHYVINYHVDGFRLIGNFNNVDNIVYDPFLKYTKLILEDVDLSKYYTDKPILYKNLSLMNHEFKNRSRSFIKGDEDNVSYISYSIRDNKSYYAPLRYITDYSGFTLYDLFSYNFKHNDDNKEENQDGENYNFSWNCGFEGKSNKLSVNKLRLKMARNAMLLIFLGQGTPVLTGGDEWLNSNRGNNNPWCQDNEIGWVVYDKLKANKDFDLFVKNLSAFRKRHSVLHQPHELKLFDYMSCKLPDVSFHSDIPFKMDQTPVSRAFGMLLAGDYSKQYTKQAEDSIYIIFNMYWEPVKFCMPVIDSKYKWLYLYNSDGSTSQDFDEEKAILYTDREYVALGRTISIFLLRKDK